MEVSVGYKLKPGDRAPNFKLPGVQGGRESEFDLASFAGAKALVVAFWCNHCPYVRAYEKRLVDWFEDARKHGVALVAINSNDGKQYPEDDFPHMVARAKEHGYQFPYLRDEEQTVAAEYGAQCTPQFLVFDASFHLVYQGRFDDNKDHPTQAQKRYLPEVVDDLLGGRAPRHQQSWALGCSIKWG
jgi:peroxiredoxin